MGASGAGGGGGVVSVVIAGLGGQGVLKASDILSEAAFAAGLDVKKSEVHGMSQRGGSVASDVRFGAKVYSPMAPVGEADYLVVLAEDQVEVFRHRLSPRGELIEPKRLAGAGEKVNDRVVNVALLGVLAERLGLGEGHGLTEAHWGAALRKCLPAKHLAMNERAFAAGREAGRREGG